MRKTVSIVLSAVIVLSSLTIGFSCITMNTNQLMRKREIDNFWRQLSEFDGEVTNRLIVRSKKKIDLLNAVDVASGYENTYFLQFKNEEDLLCAYNYYNALDYVDSVKRETAMKTDAAHALSDTKCYGTANSNIDDALKLINTYYDDLPEIKIGVIDTGAENSELMGDRLVGGYDSLPDEDSHGSYVVGTIFYNTPDNVKIYSYKAGNGTTIGAEAATAAVKKAVSDGCKIINMSFGDENGDISLHNAIISASAKGVIFVASAGNDGKNLSLYNQYPAEYAEVLAIGNMTASRALSPTSNYGTGIFSYVTGTSVRTNFRGEDVYWGGTSAAAPMFTSIVADILSVNPKLSLIEIKRSIQNTEMSPNEDNTSRNMPDAYAAIKSITGKELPSVKLDYTVTENQQTGCSDITFSCDNGANIYYYLSSGGDTVYPIDTDCLQYHHRYESGTTVSLDDKYVINAVAYSENKKKSELLHITVPDYDNNDYCFSSAANTIKYCRVDDKTIYIPETIEGASVKKIGDFCFSGNKSAEIIVLPDSVKQIGQYAFSNCPNLKKVVAPGVTICGRYSFQNCRNLKEVIMPLDTTTYTGMFKNCTSLIIAQIGAKDYLTSRYNKAFEGCENIINYNFINQNFFFDKIMNGKFVYTLSDNSDSILESPDEILFLWDSYYINRKPQTSGFDIFGRFDSTALFDINKDGIVNAKDYAIIRQAAEKY